MDGPVAMQTLLSTGEIRPGRAADVLRVLLEARPDCLDVVVTTTKMKVRGIGGREKHGGRGVVGVRGKAAVRELTSPPAAAGPCGGESDPSFMLVPACDDAGPCAVCRHPCGEPVQAAAAAAPASLPHALLALPGGPPREAVDEGLQRAGLPALLLPHLTARRRPRRGGRRLWCHAASSRRPHGLRRRQWRGAVHGGGAHAAPEDRRGARGLHQPGTTHS